jgi:hypothetical protein
VYQEEYRLDRGETNIAAAFRHLAAVPTKAVELVTRLPLQLL